MFKGKYLKYTPEITREIFSRIWKILLDHGWEEVYKDSEENTWLRFSEEYKWLESAPFLTDDRRKLFCTYEEVNYSNEKITLKEFLSFDKSIIEEDPLITEAKKRYPIGTRFHPAHINQIGEKVYCVIVDHNFESDGNQVEIGRAHV